MFIVPFEGIISLHGNRGFICLVPSPTLSTEPARIKGKKCQCKKGKQKKEDEVGVMEEAERKGKNLVSGNTSSSSSSRVQLFL